MRQGRSCKILRKPDFSPVNTGKCGDEKSKNEYFHDFTTDGGTCDKSKLR
jgi:hypothetical protein